MLYAKGMLAEAYTGASGSKKTDEFFSYSKRGEKTDVWECTPHSGTNGCASVSNYYHVAATFWANGSLNTLGSNISGVPSQTYGADPMGRVQSVTAGSGTNPVSSTSYDLTTYKYKVTFGSGDLDELDLDPNTGRMSKYIFNMGSYSDTGLMTWNANGSLANFQIIDTVPTTTDTENCAYVHDDLSRIKSVNCLNGSTKIWNQAFTYDAFGNIAKTTTSPGTSFAGTYSSSTNQLTLSGMTYDSNGQMTSDGSNSFSWDVNGNMLTLNTTTLTYDALGRMVEKSASGVYTQFVYGVHSEQFAAMSAQTLQKAFIPLPASVAVYTSSGLAYFRHSDHLGSVRLETTPSKTLYSSTAYAPFGETYASVGAADFSFTGQDQDTLSGTISGTQGMYDFMFRKQNPVQGRWMSPDPAGTASANPANPQSWNRYAYVLNNPMSLIDPLGLDCVIAYEDGTVGVVSGDCPGNDPNNEFYFDCDGCLTSASQAYTTAQGNLILLTLLGYDGLDLLQTIPNFDYTDPGVSATIPDFTAPVTGIAYGPPSTSGGGAANYATIQPISRAKCAAVFADSIAAHTSGDLPDNPVVQALLGNSISGLYDLWNSPSIGEGLETLVYGGVNPGFPGPSIGGGASGVVTDATIKGIATNLGPAAAETAASWFGLLKLAYDASAFGYEYVAKCK